VPQIRFAPAALRDLTRLREFLKAKNPAAARRAATSIIAGVRTLERHPQIGRPAGDEAGRYRELIIDFGDSGYIALYRIDDDWITVVALRHQKEAGY
jgi:addiction module RelE/StbE family toxin